MSDVADPLAAFNPFAPAALECPHAGWAMLRREAPIHRLDMPHIDAPVFMVTGRAEIEEIARDPATFSNHPVASVWRWGEFEPEIAAAFAKCGRKVAHTLASSDPPEASEYRRIALKMLDRKPVAARQPELDEIIDKLIAAIPHNENFNFVEAFSVPLPLLVICLILGVPYEDAGLIRFFSDEFTHLVDPVHSTARAARAADAVADEYIYFERHLNHYREHPAENLLSEIAKGTIHGRPITMEEALSMCNNLAIAGNETTRNALSMAMLTLCRNPDLWAQLKQNPDRVSDFVEETLRIDAPATTTARQAMADAVISGVTIPKGSNLFLMWGSASTDERVFDNPQHFDLDRRGKRAHYTFGYGIHNCVGSYLARAELNTAVRQWLIAFDSVALAEPDAGVYHDAVFGFRSVSNLPVRVRRAA